MSKILLYDYASHVVQLCTLMSYNYRCSCRTTIGAHVVQHENLIKTVLLQGNIPTQKVCSDLFDAVIMLYDAPCIG